jgi:hypothetical protein
VAARVRVDSAGLNLRAAPDTASDVLAQLPALRPLSLVGRTGDNAWLRVIVPDSTAGWVAAEWVELFVPLDQVPVLGGAELTPPPAAPSPEAEATAQPVASATPAATLPAPQGGYRYYQGLTSRVRDIFLRGQARGNKPNVFSKVGDSITVSAVFLQPIGAGSYSLHEHAALQAVIDYYSGAVARGSANSFANPSLAAKVGWRARAVLSPAAADPAVCQPDEPPLACEYRLVQPSIALIMLGTNDVPYTPVDEYERDMRRVLDFTLERDIVPILSTIPPLFRAGLEGRAEALNAVLVRLAGEYQIPLWDYWAALQGLPNQGLVSDGVHPTWAPPGHAADFSPEYLQYGMTVRNLTGLYVLDAVWRAAVMP